MNLLEVLLRLLFWLGMETGTDLGAQNPPGCVWGVPGSGGVPGPHFQREAHIGLSACYVACCSVLQQTPVQVLTADMIGRFLVCWFLFGLSEFQRTYTCQGKVR